MEILDVYHGAKGDDILKIIQQGAFRPGRGGEIYFVQYDVGEAMQYGPDESRMASYAIRAKIEVPLTATVERLQRPGAPPHTLRVTSSLPIKGEVTEMYIRKPGNSQLQVIKGATEIKKALTA